MAVTLSIANHHASLPIAYRLYLPRAWADDAARRAKAHVPDAIAFKTKPQSALEQIRTALLAGVARGVVLIDASYGSNKALRDGITALGLSYAAAIVPTAMSRRRGGGDRPGRGHRLRGTSAPTLLTQIKVYSTQRYIN